MNGQSVTKGDILVATFAFNHGRIHRIDPESGGNTIALSGGELEGANITGMEFDCNGDLLVSTFDRVLRIDIRSNQQTVIARQPVVQPSLPSFWTDVCCVGKQRVFLQPLTNPRLS